MMLPLVIAVMPEGADRDYMEWLFVEHHRLMMVTAFGIVPQSADADEIVSDSLIALYKKIDKLRGMEKNALRLYIVSTVRNTSLNYLKKASANEQPVPAHAGRGHLPGTRQGQHGRKDRPVRGTGSGAHGHPRIARARVHGDSAQV